MTELATACVSGIGFWTPTIANWNIAREIRAGRSQPASQPSARPPAALLPPAERRRAPDSVLVACEAATQACAMANADTARMPSIFVSRWGDLHINDYMCSTLAKTPSLCSPTKFHNSVHNAAAGYWTIGNHCMRASSALLAGADSFGAGLLEALSQCAIDRSAVLLVAYDIDARGPMTRLAESECQCAFALVIEPVTDTRDAIQIVADIRPRAEASTRASPAHIPAEWSRAVPRNPMRPALELLDVLDAGAGMCAFPIGTGVTLDIRVVRERETV